MPSGVCSIKSQIRYISLEIIFFFNRRIILTSFMRLVASILECSSILSAYLWYLSLLISFLTCGTLRSWCGVSLVMYQDALTMILKYLFWNLCNISTFELETVPQSWMPIWVQGLPCTTATYSRSIVAICCWAASTFCLLNMCFLQFSLRSKCSPK